MIVFLPFSIGLFIFFLIAIFIAKIRHKPQLKDIFGKEMYIFLGLMFGLWTLGYYSSFFEYIGKVENCNGFYKPLMYFIPWMTVVLMIALFFKKLPKISITGVLLVNLISIIFFYQRLSSDIGFNL